MSLTVMIVAVNVIMNMAGMTQKQSTSGNLATLDSSIRQKCRDGQTSNPTTTSLKVSDLDISGVDRMYIAGSSKDFLRAEMKKGDVWSSEKYDSNCDITLEDNSDGDKIVEGGTWTFVISFDGSTTDIKVVGNKVG